MRMWPDEAEHFLGHYRDLELVHPQLAKRRVAVGPAGFGAFCAEARPLACLYIPERRDPAAWGDGVEITPLRPTAALMALVRNAFTARAVEALGWQRSRLMVLGDLVQRVPVRRLIYPSGFQRLPQVRQALLRDLEGLVDPGVISRACLQQSSAGLDSHIRCVISAPFCNIIVIVTIRTVARRY